MDSQSHQNTHGNHLLNIAPPMYNIVPAGASYGPVNAGNRASGMYVGMPNVLTSHTPLYMTQGPNPQHLPHPSTNRILNSNAPNTNLQSALYFPLPVSTSNNSGSVGANGVYMNNPISALYNSAFLTTSPISNYPHVSLYTPVQHMNQSSGMENADSSHSSPASTLQKGSGNGTEASPRKDDDKLSQVKEAALLNEMKSLSVSVTPVSNHGTHHSGMTIYSHSVATRRNTNDLPGDPREPLYHEIFLDSFKKDHLPPEMHQEPLSRDGILPNGECYSQVGSVKVFIFACKDHYISHYVNYYFSRENLTRDAYTTQKLHDNKGVIYLADLAQYPKLREVGASVADILAALKSSGRVDVITSSDGRPCARRKDLWYPETEAVTSAVSSPTIASQSTEGSIQETSAFVPTSISSPVNVSSPHSDAGFSSSGVNVQNQFFVTPPTSAAAPFYAVPPPISHHHQQVSPNNHRLPLLPPQNYSHHQPPPSMALRDQSGRYLRQTFASYPTPVVASFSCEQENSNWMLAASPHHQSQVSFNGYSVPLQSGQNVWPVNNFNFSHAASTENGSSATSLHSHTATPSPYFPRSGNGLLSNGMHFPLATHLPPGGILTASAIVE